MPVRRLKVLARHIERLAAGLALLVVFLYFAAVRPLGNLAAAEYKRHDAARHALREAQLRVDRLEKFQAALPDAEDQMRVFLREHMPSRRQGHSRAARLVRQLTQASEVELVSVAYHLDSQGDEPLRRLGIEVGVEGPFQSVMKFAHALESGSDFIVLRDFTFEVDEGGAVALRLKVDLYLQP